MLCLSKTGYTPTKMGTKMTTNFIRWDVTSAGYSRETGYPSRHDEPDIWGCGIVWEDDRHGLRSVYYKDICNGGDEVPIALSDGMYLSDIAIWEDLIVWQGLSPDKPWKIYAMSISEKNIAIDLVNCPGPAALQGDLFELRARVSNVGTAEVLDVPITFYTEDAQGQKTQIGVTQNVSLPAGETDEVSVEWTLAFPLNYTIRVEAELLEDITDLIDSCTSTISGRVLTRDALGNTVGLEGVVMKGMPGDPVTDANGYYEAEIPFGWSYTVTPEKDCWNFEPASRQYSEVISGHSGQDFSAIEQRHTISGYVKNAFGQGIGAVLLKGAEDEFLTAADGYFSLSVPCGWSGTLTPENDLCTFTPSSLTFSDMRSDLTGQSFEGYILDLSLAADPQTGAAPLTVNFTCTAIDGDDPSPITEFKWDFDGDGVVDQTTVTNIASHTYNDWDTYKAVGQK